MDEESIHPLVLVTITVYLVVSEGLTVIIESVKFPGCHKKVPPPVAVKVVLSPAQITVSPVTVTGCDGITDTTMLSVAEQPLASVTKYLVVTNGDATTVDPVVVVRPVLGDHE
jgi:hypothetical protein